jgi:drug/metabolite transporter (DMT)-like permease
MPRVAGEKKLAMTEVWGVLAAVVSSVLGGTSIGATRFLVNAIDPLAIGSFRFGVGFLLLLPAALVQGHRWPRGTIGRRSQAWACSSMPRFRSFSTRP